MSEVGRVGLGIEFVGDIGKQINTFAKQLGEKMGKAFGATLKGVDFSDAMKDAVNGTGDLNESLKATVKGVNDMTEAVKGTTAEIKEAEKAADSLAAKMSKVPKIPASVVQPNVPMNVVKPSAPKTPTVKPAIDTGAVSRELEQLTAVLDNVNAKIEIQQRKLTELKQSYENTFNDVKKNKLQEQIVNTEATILRLTKQSDTTSAKIWKLEDSLKATGQAARIVEKPVKKVDQNLKKTNRTLNTTDKRLKSTAKSAGLASKAFTGARKSVGNFGNQFTMAFKRIAKQVLIFAVLYRAIRSFQQFMGSALNTNDEFRRSLQTIRTNLAVAFQPIFEAVLPALNAFMAALARITTYIATFVSVMFGKTYKQSLEAAKGLDANRKAMDGYGKAAKKASGQLAGFDELNVIGDPSQGALDGLSGISGLGDLAPDINIDEIQNQVTGFVEKAKLLFGELVQITEEDKEKIVTSVDGVTGSFSNLKSALRGLGEAINESPTLSGLFANFKSWTVDSLASKFRMLGGGIDQVSGAANLLSGILKGDFETSMLGVEQLISGTYDVITGLFLNFFPWLGDDVVEFKERFSAAWRQIKDDAKKYGDPTKLEIRDFADYIYDKITTRLEDIRDNSDKQWKRIAASALLNFDKIRKMDWSEIKDAVQETWNKLAERTKEKWQEIKDTIQKRFDETGSATDQFALGLMKTFEGIVDFIAGTFTGDWERAWNGIKTFTEGIGESIVAVFRGAVNSIIDQFNRMIRNLNKISVDIPDWVPGDLGGKSFGVNIPQIPKLAKGGLVQGPTLAMVGDNPGANVDPEVVSPLSRLQEMLSGAGGGQEVVDALYMIIDLLQEYARRPVVLEANGTQLARVVDKSRDDRSRRAGRTLGLL